MEIILNKAEDLSSPIGKHGADGGSISISSVSDTDQALVCSVCGMRVVISKEIKTPRQLWEYLE